MIDLTAFLKRSSIFLFFLICSTPSFGQPPLDSLLRKINSQKEDTNKAKLYYDIGKSYFAKDRTLFKTYIDSCFRLSRKLKYSNGLGLSYTGYAYYHLWENDWEKVRYNLQKSDSIYEKLGKTAMLMRNKELHASYYSYIGAYDKSIQQDLELLRYYQQTNAKPSEAKMLGSIAIHLTKLERYKEAEEYYKKSIALRRELKDYPGLSLVLLNFGGMLAEQRKYLRAEPYLEESLQLQKTIKDQNYYFAKANLTHVYAETGRPNKALKFAKECHTFFGKNKDTTTVVTLTIYESIAYAKLKQYDLALRALQSKHHMIKNQQVYSGLEADLLWQYYKVYKSMGKSDIALEYLEAAKSMEDQNRDMRVQHTVSTAKEYYESNKKQEENEQLRKDNELKDLQISRRNYIVFGSILLASLISVIAFGRIRYNRLNAEKAAMAMEQRLLRSQMNPHFIFNALHSIHTHMLKKDSEEAGKLLTSFARLMRSVLNNSSTDAVLLSDELSWLRNYIKLQQLRFNNSFETTIDLDETISPDNTLLPPMLIQPFIENAIEHGFSGLDRPGLLTISYRKTPGIIEIEITDNGKGFLPNQTPAHKNDEHSSAGIRITEKRLQLLNKKKRGGFRFSISSHPNEGTRVFFSIPHQTKFD